MTRLALLIATTLCAVWHMSQPASAQEDTQTPVEIRFSLDWKIEGPAAPFLLALDKGFFADESLDVTVEPGANSVDAVQRVATGGYDMALGDINSLIRFTARDDEVRPKAVFMLYDKPPFAIVGRKSRGISDPASLEGKTLGAPKSDAAFAQWPIFLKANGLDAKAVKILNIGFPVREPMLAAGEVDAITGYSYSAAISLRDKGVPAADIVVMAMADHGVPLYGNALLVNPDFADAHPEAVTGFIRAIIKGIRLALANPDAAIAGVLDRNPNAVRATEIERLRAALDGNIVTQGVRLNGIGGVDETRLAASIELIAEAQGLKDKPEPADVFDASFLPPAEERRLD